MYELQKFHQVLWEQLPQDSINNATLSLPKQLPVGVNAYGAHVKHMPPTSTSLISVFEAAVIFIHEGNAHFLLIIPYVHEKLADNTSSAIV